MKNAVLTSGGARLIHPKKRVHKAQVVNWIIFAVVLLGAVVVLWPFLWMLSTSFKADQHVYSTGIIPIEWHFENYSKIWQEVPLLRGYLNSIIIVVPNVLGNVFMSALAAFAFGKLRFKFKNALFIVLLSTMMIPGVVTMIPKFVMFQAMGLLQGPLAVILPHLFGGAFSIFFMRQYLVGIPDSIVESAKIDGAGYFKIFVSMIVPLATPVIITQLILGFISHWNNYLEPLLYLRNRDWYTITLVIAAFKSSPSGAGNSVPLLMAASLVSMLPIFVVFSVFQKKIVNSVMMSGAKN